MKRFVLLFPAFLLLAFSPKFTENVYDILFYTLDGTEKSMMTFEGQKVLVVVLPGQVRDSDTTMLRRIGEISLQYKEQLKVIGVPSTEDGFDPANSPATWYHTYLGTEVMVTEAMNTASTAAQSPLFSWLTTEEKNGSFNQEVSGAGHLFCINGVGEIIAVLDKDTELTEEIIQRIIAL